MSAFTDYRLLWRAAFVQRQPSRTLPWSFVLAGLLSFLGSAAGYFHEGCLLSLRVGVAVSLIVLQFLWMVHLLPGFALMNTPANARLVPRMRKRMIQMTVAGWLVAFVAMLLLPVWKLAPLVAMYMMSVSTGRSGNRTVFAFAAILACSYVLLKDISPDLLAFFKSVPGFVCLSLIAAIFGAWCVRVILPAGGDRHFAERKQRVETIESLESMVSKRADLAPKRVTSLYALALRQAIRSGRPRRLMLHAFGPSATETLTLPAWIFVVMVCLASHFMMQRLGRPGAFPLLGWIMYLTVMLTLQVGTCIGWRTMMNSARSEQGLLRLAARSPSAGQWNRELGRALVRQVGLNAAFGALAAIVLVTVTGLDRDGTILVLSLASVLFMPSIAFMLLDYSREQNPWSLPHVLFAFAVAAIVVLAHIALQFRIGVASWLVLTGYSNAVGAIVAAVRWKKMLAAPVAFPTGRFA